MERLIDILHPRPAVNITANRRVVEMVRGEEEISAELGKVAQVTLITLQPGESAGRHHHVDKREVLHLISGRIEARFYHRTTGERLTLFLEPDQRISMIPGIEHVFRSVGEGAALLLELASLAFDPARPDSSPAQFLD